MNKDQKFKSIYLELSARYPYSHFKDPFDIKPKMSIEMGRDFYKSIENTVSQRDHYHFFTKKRDIPYELPNEVFDKIIDLENTHPYIQYTSPLFFRPCTAYSDYKMPMPCDLEKEFIEKYKKIVEGYPRKSEDG